MRYLKFLSISLFFILAACSGAEASQPAPVKEAPAEVKPEAPPVDQSQPQAESEVAVEAVQEGDDTPVIAEKPVVAKEEKPAGEEAMAAPTEKTEMPPEAAPQEEKAMTGPAATATAGPTEAQLKLLAGLENRGAPPELFNEVWLNSEPLKLADLRGKVVIVEFWTFG